MGGSILFTAPILFNSCAEDVIPEEVDENSGDGSIEIDLTNANYSALDTVGGYAYKGDIIIFRTGDSSYMALSKLCTHSQCTVTYNHANGNVPCPCHGSIFTTSGQVSNGPANSSLKRYTVTKEGNTLKLK